jgi:hypothetical protein
MKTDIIEILDELTNILDLVDDYSYEELYEQARTYIYNKRMEFLEPKGDCCG